VHHHVHPPHAPHRSTERHLGTYYYYARGCSDLYVRAGVTIVAKNRYDARVALEARVRGVDRATAVARAGIRAEISLHRGLPRGHPHNLTLCGQRANDFVAHAAAFNACTTPLTPRSQCVHVQSSLRVTDKTLFHLMARAKVDTILTLYQALCHFGIDCGATVWRVSAA